MHEVGSGTRAVTEKAFSEKKLTLRPSMTLASTEAIKHTVATGVGIAVLSAAAVRSVNHASCDGVAPSVSGTSWVGSASGSFSSR